MTDTDEIMRRLRVVQDSGWITLSARLAAEEAANEIERLQGALQQIVDWSRAYPLNAFPEPDFKMAAELLEAGGMTLDAISASNMRHVVEGVGKIASEALSLQQGDRGAN